MEWGMGGEGDVTDRTCRGRDLHRLPGGPGVSKVRLLLCIVWPCR